MPPFEQPTTEIRHHCRNLWQLEYSNPWPKHPASRWSLTQLQRYDGVNLKSISTRSHLHRFLQSHMSQIFLLPCFYPLSSFKNVYVQTHIRLSGICLDAINWIARSVCHRAFCVHHFGSPTSCVNCTNGSPSASAGNILGLGAGIL